MIKYNSNAYKEKNSFNKLKLLFKSINDLKIIKQLKINFYKH